MLEYIIGLDLGQAQDYTALALVEKLPPEPVVPHQGNAPKPKAKLAVRHLERYPLGTGYPQVVASVRELLLQLGKFLGGRLQPYYSGQSILEGCTLAVDQTGVGAPVVDMFRAAGLSAKLVPIMITAGHQVTRGARGAYNVPKKELVAACQVLFQERRLKIAKSLPLAGVLEKELLAFRAKITTAGNETFEAWRERDHDDLVLAVAIASWYGDRRRVQAGAFI